MPLLISLALLISCELREWRQRGCHCPGMWTCNLFNFTPRASKPFRLDDLTSWTKVPFAFHFLRDKRGEKVLYIVMLPHLSDISKIEVQAKDRYKLKVNTKKKKKKSVKKRSYITMFGNPFALCHMCFVCSGKAASNSICHRAAAGFTSKLWCHSSSGLVWPGSQLCGQCGGETVFLHTLLLFLPLCNEPRCHSFSFQSWFIATYNFFFSPPDIQLASNFTVSLYSPGIFSPHSSAALKETCDTIFCHYSSNIYTTLSKLHLAGNMFQCLSTPHGVAGGLTSIKGSTAKTGRQNEESGCSW